jgi:hypothetical protein
MIPEINDSRDTLPHGSMDLGNGYVLLKAKQRYPSLPSETETLAIQTYFEMNGDPGVFSHFKITRWARLHLPTGQIAHTAWKECLKPTDHLRRSRCVQVSMYFN